MNSRPKVGESHNGSVKVIRNMAALLLCCLAPRASAAQSPAQAGLLDFIATHRDRRFDGVPHEVLAFYYTWYGRPERQDHWVHWGGQNTTNHSTPQTTHYPARGAYDSQDPALVDAHIREAKSCAVSGFIATWWGQGSYEDRSFALLLARAEQKISKPASIGKPHLDQAANKLTGQSPTLFMCFRVMARTGRF